MGITTGAKMFEAAYGKPMFDYLRDNPTEEIMFSQAMTDMDGLGTTQINAWPSNPIKIVRRQQRFHIVGNCREAPQPQTDACAEEPCKACMQASS